MSYNIGIPEWQMDVTTGAFADDLDAALMEGIINLSLIFIPLFLGYLTIVYLMHRSLSNLLGALSGAMRRLAGGDLTTEIAGRDRRDELGQMAEALVTFRQAAIDKAALEKTGAEQRELLEAERRRKAEVDRLSMEANGHVVGSLGLALERLSRGDLSHSVDQAYAEEYEAIRTNFNAAVAQLREAMSGIASNTTGIRTGSVEIATAADDLAKRTERQAAALAETAASVSLVVKTVGETAQGAAEARKIVASAIDDAARGGEIVNEAVSVMGEIEKSAQQISQIIGVIDEIAFQTNLLALNAGVEAARAGDAGRGFAVVASEVRALAQRSAEAAKDIKGLIQASTAQVGKGVTQVDETGKALSRIQTRIAEINDLVTKIAASAQTQATSLAEVNIAIGEMDRATQQNAAMVEESTAASHSLASEANLLAGLVERFNLGSGGGRQTKGSLRDAA
jgi:methyl-accepting chemotaxis protein